MVLPAPPAPPPPPAAPPPPVAAPGPPAALAAPTPTLAPTAVAPTPVPPSAGHPSPAPAEQVLGTIPEARIKTGMFSKDMYVLVITDRRLIGAKVGGDLLKRIIAEARTEAKEDGKGFFGQWAAQIGASTSLGRRYAAMAPEQVLAETPGNWAIHPGEVRSIRVERKQDRDEDGGIDRQYLRLRVETATAKLQFDTDSENPPADRARALLATLFGPVVR